MATIAYDPNVDYMQLIMDAEKAGNRSLAAQYEAQRNAKIADLNATGTNQWNAQETYAYTQPKQPALNQGAMIESLYRAQQDAALAELKSAYDKNVLAIDEAKQKIPALYQQGRNRAASDAAVNARNFNQYAAASGLNTGAAGQAQLAMNNQLQSGLSELHTAEANAIAELEAQRTSITTQYQNAVAQAIAEGNAAKAQALYEEAVRTEEILRAQEEAAAKAAAKQPTAPTDEPSVNPLDGINQKQLQIAINNANQFGVDAAKRILAAYSLDPHNTLTESEARAIAQYLGW